MATLTASEARATLPDLLNRVEAGEEIIVTRHGRQVAVIVRPDVLKVRRADRAFDTASQVRERLEAGGRAPLPDRGLSPERADAHVAEVRAARDGR